MTQEEKKEYENHLHETEPRWFAVYTRYKREKLVRKMLQEKGIDCYLPLQSFTRHYTRKVKQVELPLISCYIFTRITRKQYVPVLETPDVVNFVRFSRNLISIPEAEIRLIQRIVGEGLEVEAEPSSFQPGDEVEVIGGNLTGLRGKLISKEGQKNFLVELETLGYNLRMYIEPQLLLRLKADPDWQAPPRRSGLWNL